LWRHQMTKGLMETISLDMLPQRSVLYAMHFQPEQSTLALGPFVLNQIALIENISKALPLGYTLIVKEHPAGRGRRPAWQYRHIASLPNVELCDAPAKEIAQRCDLVMTISGTIGMETLVLGKPVLLFGRSFYDYGDLILKETDSSRLHALLHKVLLQNRTEINRDELRRFLMSYLYGLVPFFPYGENDRHYGNALLEELGRTQHLNDGVQANMFVAHPNNCFAK
jgi:CDP-glycerol glycerophosphotransferase (TagB/SpsB family)